MLTLLVAVPLVGGVLLAALDNRDGARDSVVRWTALAVSLLAFVASLAIWASFDSSAGVVGTATAEFLGVPCVTAASELSIANGQGAARRELEGAAEMVTFPLPAVVTIDEGVARPCYPSLKGIMAAKKKPLESKPAQLGDVRVTVQKVELPPERPAGRIIGEGVAAIPELVQLLQTEAKVL